MAICVIRSFGTGVAGETANFKLYHDIVVLGVPAFAQDSLVTGLPVGGQQVTIPICPHTEPSLPSGTPTLVYKQLTFLNYRADIASFATGEAHAHDTVMLWLDNAGAVQVFDDDDDDDDDGALAARFDLNCTSSPTSGHFGTALVGGYWTSANNEGNGYLYENDHVGSGVSVAPTSLYGDNDGDGVYNGLETALTMNTNVADTDGDAINDGIEVFGYGLEALPWEGSSPTVKDIFVQVDYMKDAVAGNPDYFLPEAPTVISDLRYSFAAYAGIAFHLDVHAELPFTPYVNDTVGATPPANTTTFDQLQAAYYFAADRSGIFHWILSGQYQNSATGSSGCTYAVDRTVVTLGAGYPNTHTPVSDQYPFYSGTVLHELGHTFGLTHHGSTYPTADSTFYKSVMNYGYQLVGVPASGFDSPYRYSDDSYACLSSTAALSSPKQRCVDDRNSANGHTPADLSVCDCTFDEWSVLNLGFTSGTGPDGSEDSGATPGGPSDADLAALGYDRSLRVGIGGRLMGRVGAPASTSKLTQVDIQAYEDGRRAELAALEASVLTPQVVEKLRARRIACFIAAGAVLGEDFAVVDGEPRWIETQ